MNNGLGRGSGRDPAFRDAVGLNEFVGDSPGNGISFVVYDDPGGKIVGKGYPRCGRVTSAGKRRAR